MPLLPRLQSSLQEQDRWMSDLEGQLSVDVLETETHVIVRTPVAGVKRENLDVSVTPDTVTIRGERRKSQETWDRKAIVHVQECHWGKFSRSVVLPAHIRTDEVKAALKDGILTVTLKKAQAGGSVPIIDESEL